MTKRKIHNAPADYPVNPFEPLYAALWWIIRSVAKVVLMLAVLVLIAWIFAWPSRAQAGGPPTDVWLELPRPEGDCYAPNVPTSPGQARLMKEAAEPVSLLMSSGRWQSVSKVRATGGWRMMPLAERSEIMTRAKRGEVDVLIEAVALCGANGDYSRLFNIWWWRKVK